MFPKIFSIIFSLLFISSLFSNMVAASPQDTLREKITRHAKQGDALRIEITENGIYWLSYEDLIEAGVQPQLINPARLRLFNQGEEVAIQVISEESDTFKPTDYIIFYAQSIDNTFTSTNVYWLYWKKKGFGKRITYVDGSVTEQAEPITGFYDRLHVEKNKFEDIWDGEPESQDYWFWQRLNASDVKEFIVNLPALPFEQTDVVVRVGLRGRSAISSVNPDHHTLISWNDTLMSDEHWDGDSEYVQEMLIASEQIVDKYNTLTIELPGDTGAVVDTVYLNWIDVDYWRHFTAVDDKLVFTVDGSGKRQIAVKNLSQPDILIFDTTYPDAVTEIVNFVVETDGKNYKVVFEDTVNEVKTYYITTLNQLKPLPNIKLWKSARLKSVKNRADYILITASEFLPAVKPLTELRRKQGLHVKSVSVEDIYNEFNHGIFSPAAIKAFLKYAYDNWSYPIPSYVFLVGDASVDYRDYTNKAKKNKVPAYLYLAVGSKNLLIPDDNWYADVWSDYMGNYILPEMMIGRIPGDTPETVARIIAKIIRYEESTHKSPQKVLLVGDSNPRDEELSESLIDYIPDEFETDKIYLSTSLEDVETEEQKKKKIAKATRNIISSINDGAMITNYTGHGAVDRWSKVKDLFKPKNVHRLKNQDNLTFVVALTCNNGMFTVPNKYSLAEEFMLAKGGAIGVFSSSGLTYTIENEALSQGVFATIFEQTSQPLTLGYITTQAKIAAYNNGGISTGVIRSFILFGDPATRLKDW
jgi:hypothetical protein